MMEVLAALEMTGKLVLALILGGVVGLERERRDRPAGLRTNMLVCMGAALITMASIQLAGRAHDPGRVAAQIVSGIGFLGAGTIIRQGSVVRGLTTAASLWVVAGIGIAVGTGGTVLTVAVVGTLLAYLTLRVVARVERWVVRQREAEALVLRVRGGEDAARAVLAALSSLGLEIQAHRIEPLPGEDASLLRVWIVPAPGHSEERLPAAALRLHGVEAAYWDE